MSGDDRKRGCLKTGCMGCAGVVALIGIAALLTVAVALMLGKPEQRLERSEYSRELSSATVGASDRAPDELPSVGIDQPGRVVLDLNVGRFEVVAGESGQPLRVDGNYDAGSYELTESFEAEGETGWVYRVTFDRKVSWIRQLLQEDPSHNRIRVTIPRDVPIVLEGHIGLGESELELGGLALVRVDLDIGVGDHYVGFDDPTPFPMEKFRLAASIGEMRIRKLGNASPGTVWVSHRIGELDLDLRGSWRGDGEISARCGIGACVVSVPRDVAVQIDKARVGIGERDVSDLAGSSDAAEGTPRLTLEITAGLGELRVDR